MFVLLKLKRQLVCLSRFSFFFNSFPQKIGGTSHFNLFLTFFCCKCQTVTCSRSTMSFWGTLEAKTGGFRPMFMVMEASILVERKDMAYGLILLRISISTIFFGQILRSCMYDAIYLNPTCHI